MELSKKHHWLALFVLIFATFGLSAFGTLAVTSSLSVWYPSLAKPSWNPPSAVFGPVWTVLYLMMAVAAWLVWRRGSEAEVVPAMTAYFGQLVLNILWSLIFFGLKAPGWAVFDIVVLWVAIIVAIAQFGKVSRIAAWLLVPYLAWVTFASLLNITIWRMNG
ncbi:MAG: TspO/MBR family protein [Chthoniobacter sp.]|uniref:TspO/MBR family protein n=1 Tax=Chthoniobacter sp. TaxID=2510640 RepID=UPI0032A9B82A